MEEDPVDRFGRTIGLEPEAIVWMRDLPVEVLSVAIEQFDGSGSKDGNVMGRLQGYCRHLCKRSGHQPPESLGAPAAKERPEHGGHANAVTAVSWVADGGGASPALPEFARRIGLTGAAEEFLARLPQEVLAKVINGFDPGGTKDGNVWGRLLGYVRSLWARHVHVDQETSAYIRSLPEETQLLIMMEFDPRGSKDGNVGARLAHFIAHIEQRGVPPPSSSPGGGALAQASLQPMAAAPVAAVSHGADIDAAIIDFSQRMMLDNQALAFLQSLEREVISVVISKFDPSGTKDGNVWGRLLGYIRNVWCRHKGDQALVQQMRSMPEHEQMQAMADPALESRQTKAVASKGGKGKGSHPAVHGGGGSVRQFSLQWGLNSNAEAFVGALPAPVQQQVITGFDASRSKDGNVWGRLLGFARQVWVKYLGLDATVTQQVKGLPEEAQMLCMTTFDPSTSKDGNIGARLQGFMNKCLKQAGGAPKGKGGDPAFGKGGKGKGGAGGQELNAAAYGNAGSPGWSDVTPQGSDQPLSHDPTVLAFLERCGLDLSAVDCLQQLPEDLLHQVMSDFDPSGTKDGNVLGRLQGYVKFLARKRGLPIDGGGAPAKRPRAY